MTVNYVNPKDVRLWEKEKTQPSNYIIAGVIRHEIIRAITKAPRLDYKGPYINEALEKLFDSVDWTQSFHTPMVILHDEILQSEVLIGIHRWLRAKCADIENIIIVVTQHLGVPAWWKQWCQVNHEKSFKVITWVPTECFWFQDHYDFSTISLPKEEWILKQKTQGINRLFSYYGGSHSQLDRVYITLKMLEFDSSAVVDFMASFPGLQEIQDYVEQITYFKNQPEIDRMAYMYEKFVGPDGKLTSTVAKQYKQQQTLHEQINYQGLQWNIDRDCFATVVRETVNSDVYATVTEKTLRGFLHYTAVVPTGYRAVTELESLGFRFPRDLIDYNYENQRDFYTRILELSKSLEQIQNCDLRSYFVDNFANFQHNAQLVVNLMKLSQA